MPIVGFQYDPAGDDSVYFVPPEDRPKELKRIRFLLLLAAFVSMFTAGANMLLMVDIYSATDLLSKRGEQLIQDPQVRDLVQAEAPAILEKLAEERGDPPPTVPDIEQAADMGVDALKMSVILSGNVMLVLLILTFYFPVKYLLIRRRAAQGQPECIRVIRATVWAQIGVELFRHFNLFLMNAEASVLELPNYPSPTLVLAVLILLNIRRDHVREFFSDYKVLPAPTQVVEAWKASQGQPPAAPPSPTHRPA